MENYMRFNATEEYVKVMGRTVYRDDIRFLGYSASSISFVFEGKKVSIGVVTDEKEKTDFFHAYLGIFAYDSEGKIIDLGGVNKEKRIEILKSKEHYDIFEADKEGVYTVKIVKYSEAEYDTCGIKYIETDSDKVVRPAPKALHRVEVIGDSITCGYGTEGNEEEYIHRTETENPISAYACTALSEFDADYNIVAWNGKGILTGYIGEDTPPVKDQSWLISMLYDYTDAGLERDYFKADKKDWEVWDNAAFVPELIIMNLGTNDCSYTRGDEARSLEYTDVYVEFLEKVHTKNPEAKLLCILGMMDPRLNDYVELAVKRFSEKHSEATIRFEAFPVQAEEDGYGINFHPTPKYHAKAGKKLAGIIRDYMGW